jgi:hypothetical protein
VVHVAFMQEMCISRFGLKAWREDSTWKTHV